ncbi:MAG: nuclear transport factor 2 family protein [Alcanivorax sp.]|uniref:nuclear transport factor 2 family protein n=1 Tax=Alloalcanivorax marinus TaxID=1177169 RepID=UPI00195EA779|nr:nuclear transport factor 2 family protein [Alloalcanivorax marinus]MBM7334968.1 nuclear transport factor 2 family protein [Alloalcanivorax marinus]
MAYPTFLIRALLAPLALTLLLTGCASRAADQQQGYSHLYEQGLRSRQGASPVSDQALQRFIDLYSPIDADYIEAHLDDVYAPDLYFNDTLATIYDRETLKAHMLKTAERLDYMNLDVQQTWRDGEDVFLRWIMETHFSIMGSEREARTIGISQLRFDDQGRVIFHQDFWDSSQGLDQHLPILGTVTRWLREHP